MWFYLALGAAALTSFNPILYKRMLKAADPLVIVWAVTLLALPLLGAFTLALTGGLPRFDWLFAAGVLGSAGLNAIAHLASTRALKLGDVSLVTPLLTFSPVFTLFIAALFLGEIPSVIGLLGAGFVLMGAYWLNYEPRTDWLAPFKMIVFTPSILLVLLAGVLWAITPLFEKTAILHTEPESPRFVAFTATFLLVLLLTPIVMVRGKVAVRKLSLHLRELFPAGLIAGIAPVLGYTAFSLGFVGYVTTIFKLSTLFTLFWSSLFLKETRAIQRLPASIVMVTGIVLITM